MMRVSSRLGCGVRVSYLQQEAAEVAGGEERARVAVAQHLPLALERLPVETKRRVVVKAIHVHVRQVVSARQQTASRISLRPTPQSGGVCCVRLHGEESVGVGVAEAAPVAGHRLRQQRQRLAVVPELRVRRAQVRDRRERHLVWRSSLSSGL